MKRYIYAGLLMLLPFVGSSQDKIEGIGILRLGKTTPDVIKELAKNHRNRIKEVNDRSYEKDGGAVFKLLYNDDQKKRPSYSSACPDVEVYYLQRYVVADVKMTDVYLRFYKGVLISYSCAGNKELGEALTIKYGEPVRSSKEKASNCNGRVDKEFKSYWENDRIEAFLTDNFFYGFTCSLMSLSSFYVSLTDQTKLADECSHEYAPNLVDPKKKEKLKDF